MEKGYRRPPIAEAIVELRFGGFARQSDLQDAKTGLTSAYARVEDLQQVTMNLSLDQAKPPRPILVGHKLTSADGTGVVQITESVFVFSQLPPYPGWPAFEKRARAALRKAGTLYANRPIVRAALRYINRIDVPLGADENASVDDYLTVTVTDLPFEHESIGAMSFNIATAIDGGRFGVAINGGRASPPLLQQISFLLDISVYNQVNVPGFRKIWEHIREMRDWKNRVFEACVTDRARELFQ